jgi:hypothetical protein
MSIKKCCTKVIDFNSQSIAENLYKDVIAPQLEEIHDGRIVLNGEVLLAANSIDATVLEVVSSFNAKITVFYFMKLL